MSEFPKAPIPQEVPTPQLPEQQVNDPTCEGLESENGNA